MSIGRVPGATGIQPSIVTAKGDLIVATASGSVTNQAVGSNNQVLTADSAQADGVKWANGSAATLTTTGDLLYASAANTPARLAIGSTNQVLTVSGGVPTWATPAGGGKVLQVVQATNSTETQVASTTFTDTGLSVSITPSATSSKILIIASQQYAVQRSSNAAGGGLRLLRNTTEILNNDGGSNNSYFAIDQGSGPSFTYGNVYNPVIYLDSPSTTSSVTYKTQIRSYTTANSGSVWAQVGNATSTIIAMEIGA